MKQEDYKGYKVGALKRKFKTGRADVAPGTFISQMNAQKVAQRKEKSNNEVSPKEKVAIMGLI